MSIDNALAGVAAKNLDATAKWYAQLIGAPGNQPMEGVFEWSLPGGGALQLFKDLGRAGSSSVTFSVKGIDDHVARLSAHGIEVGRVNRTEKVTTALVQDPDGNQVVLAEQHSSDVVR